MYFLDVCSGIGAGHIALKNLGCESVGFLEVDKRAEKTYRILTNSDKINFGDVTKIDPQEIPDFDLLISGFPCQSFSIVGQREGFNDYKQGRIIFHLMNILKIKQPQFFILENVKRLINHNKGSSFNFIL